MNQELPARLKAAANVLLEGVSRKELAARAAAISQGYRAGGGSAETVSDPLSVLAYVFSRLPATYAVAAAVFAATREAAPGFAPRTLVDVGAGPGTASWAAVEAWPELHSVTMTDWNASFLAMARTLALASLQGALANAVIVASDVNDPGTATPRADLVTASFVLAELSAPNLATVVERLWSVTNEVLVLIEPGTPAGFARIRNARAWLIAQGAHVLGPCTHANVCPIADPDWCHFSQRLVRSRDHMRTKKASVPFEDERYSWIAVARNHRSENSAKARLLAAPRQTKPGIAVKLCAADGITNKIVPRRDKEAFAAARRSGWGDVV